MPARRVIMHPGAAEAAPVPPEEIGRNHINRGTNSGGYRVAAARRHRRRAAATSGRRCSSASTVSCEAES